jgi:hypothetical protein
MPSTSVRYVRFRSSDVAARRAVESRGVRSRASWSRDRTGTQLRLPATTAHGEQPSIYMQTKNAKPQRSEWRVVHCGPHKRETAHAAGMHGAATEAQQKCSITAPSAGSSCTEKSRWHSSVLSTQSSHVRGRAWERRERLQQHVARDDQVLLVVEVQLAERHVRSRACHVDVEVARARTAVRGGHAAKNRLAEGT